MLKIERCGSCEHWTEFAMGGGDCRRFPAWVVTEEDHYCSEFLCCLAGLECDICEYKSHCDYYLP